MRRSVQRGRIGHNNRNVTHDEFLKNDVGVYINAASITDIRNGIGTTLLNWLIVIQGE